MPSTSTEATITPRIILNTAIVDIESGVKRETAMVGEPLIWDIEGPGIIQQMGHCKGGSS